MEIAEHTEADKLVIALGGRLDSNTSPEFEELICPRMDTTGAVIVDMSRLDYVSSAGLRVLLKAAKIARSSQHRRSRLLGGNDRGGGRHAEPAEPDSLLSNRGQTLSK